MPASAKKEENKRRREVAVYAYKDDLGHTLFEVVRYEPKDFRVRHNDDSGKTINKAPERNIPYRLPEILSSHPQDIIYIVEGEKDADSLIKRGITATCNRGGCGNTKAFHIFTQWFQGRRVCILPDNDEAGRAHAQLVCSILEEVTVEIGILDLEGLPEKGDVSDWLAFEANTVKKLDYLAEQCLTESRRAKMMRGGNRNDVEGMSDARDQADETDEDSKPFNFDWKPLPLEILPYTLRKYVTEMSKALKVEPAMIALPALIACAGVVGNARRVRLLTTWTEPCILYGCIIADSSSRKSPAMDAAFEAVKKLDALLNKSYRSDLICHNAAYAKWERSMTDPTRDTDAEEGNKAPEPPTDKRILIGDITVETTLGIHYKNPRGLLLKQDELRSWFASFGRYKSGGAGGAEMAFWLEAFRGQEWRYNRKSGDNNSIIIPHVACSLFGTTQPSTAARTFTRDYFESGLASRILLMMPPAIQGTWDRYTPEPATIEAYEHLITRLHKLDWEMTQDPEFEPRDILLLPEAEEIWGPWYDQNEATQHVSEGDVKSMLSKLQGMVPRFAMLFSLCDFVMGETDTEHIGLNHLVNAMLLADWMGNEVQRIYAFLKLDTVESSELKIVNFLLKHGGFATATDLYKSNRPKYKSRDEALSLLKGLVDKGILDMVDTVPGRIMTRPTWYFTPKPRPPFTP